MPKLLKWQEVMRAARQPEQCWYSKDELPVSVATDGVRQYHTVFSCPVSRLERARREQRQGSLVVEEFMHGEPLTVHEQDSAVNVAELMVTQKPKIYPVVDDKGILVGLLTREQVLRALKDSRRGCD